jgi:PadR family transcriptional regulator PadR
MARKRSHQTKLILQVLLEAPEDEEEAYGLSVVRASGVPAGTTYTILRRLEDEGLVDSYWEQIDARDAGRPPRRFYSLNAAGRRVAQDETAEQRRALRMLVPGWSS